MRSEGWLVAGTMAITAALGACSDESSVVSADCGDVETVELTVRFGRNPMPSIGSTLFLGVAASDECGRAVPIEETRWTSSDPSVVIAGPAFQQVGNDGEPFVIPEEGRARAVGFGRATIRAEVEGAATTLEVEVVRPPLRAQGFEVLGADSVSRRLTDLWVHGDYVYTGTSFSCGSAESPCGAMPGRLMVWRLEGGIPVLIDSVALPAPRTNDVKVSPSGDYLVVSQEGDDAVNGIVILDLADPAAPTITTHFTAELEGGVHNLWLEEIDGTDWAFVAEDGSGAEERLHVLDLSDPSTPVVATRWWGRASQVHDVYVRDGLAFIAHWDDGLVILDVGNGMAGGSPGEPAVVSSLTMSGGNTHNAWYWPEGQVVFVGEERSSLSDTTDVGRLHVVDVSDMSDPREIGGYLIPGATPHNFWLDEENRILYAAWNERGVRALDVSGDLPADMGTREIGFIEVSGSRGLGSVWAPQLHRGVLYLSDSHHGVWAVRPPG